MGVQGRNQELSKQVSNLQNDLDLSKSELAQTQTLLQKRTNDLHEANLLQSALEQNRKENRDLNDEVRQVFLMTPANCVRQSQH